MSSILVFDCLFDEMLVLLEGFGYCHGEGHQSC